MQGRTTFSLYLNDNKPVLDDDVGHNYIHIGRLLEINFLNHYQTVKRTVT